jgi:hypothetical protein
MTDSNPIRLMIYDATCSGVGLRPGLADAWRWGGRLYRMLGRFDAWCGVSSWAEAFDWLAAINRERPIGEIQFWGHGQWGGLWVGEELLTAEYLADDHWMHDKLVAVKRRLISGDRALWWFRSCDTFGTSIGHEFAVGWSRFFECQAAGHTHTIHFWQSGLHLLKCGDTPSWPSEEGVVKGLAHARESHPLRPRTITCLHGKLPRFAL